MKKRLISLILSSMMVFSLVAPAMADAPTYAGEIAGEGNVVAPPHHIEVTLPSAPLIFLIDTEGVVPVPAGSVLSGPAANRGNIVFRSGEVQRIINRSSHTMNVGVEFLLGTAAESPNQFTFLSANDTLNTGTDKNAFIRAYVSTANVPETTTAFAGTNVRVLTSTAEATPATATFRIPGAAFDVEEYPANSGNFRRVKNVVPNYQGVALRLAGNVNSNTDVVWNGNEELSIRIRFAFHTGGNLPNAATPSPTTPPAMHLIEWTALPLTDFIAQSLQGSGDIGGQGPSVGFHGAGASNGFTITSATTATIATGTAGVTTIPFVLPPGAAFSVLNHSDAVLPAGDFVYTDGIITMAANRTTALSGTIGRAWTIRVVAGGVTTNHTITTIA